VSQAHEVLGHTSWCLQSFPVILDVSIASYVLPTTDKVTTLGVILDSKLTFDAHISAVCKNAHFHLRALCHIRSSLTTDMATSIAVAFVQLRLDYVNSLLYRVSTRNIRKLQCCQNTAACLILQQSLTPSTQDLMNQPHWLPIQARIDFKISTLTYKALSSGQPAYLRELISPYKPSRQLQSSDQSLLTMPRTNLTIGQRAFSWSSVLIWNSIPLFVRNAPTISTFKRRLKTFYFSSISS